MYSQASTTVVDVMVLPELVNRTAPVTAWPSSSSDQGGPHMKAVLSEHVCWNITAVACKIARVTATHMTHRLASGVCLTWLTVTLEM